MTAPAPGIDVQNDAGYPVDVSRLTQAIQTVILQYGGAPETAVSVVIADDAGVRDLNREFRGVDSVTDVLSFPADPLPPELAQELNDMPYLGDIVIAYPYASAQAQALGHPLDDSMALLAVHGTLHLLGYDHDTPEHRATMWAAQERALTALGISTALVPALEDAAHD